ncbi:HlyD family type I secretion periplasmic adaptor subunit [Brucella intermedia]|uniref:HlyD family type I secretion periplasmic adaptor subunit n=1 Tax=Brucella intermedia TaxID=94625 RepID=UPI001F378042|nr:HlyD family type I secretion periplasmic adaptor subunit [Brucella intermedia]
MRKLLFGALSNSSAHRKDMEFLPAVLETLETPASPVRIAFIWFICILVVAVLLWSWFGKFDIVATAQGKLQPAGRVKIITSLESGRTSAVAVTNGTHVRAGDIIVELDDGEVKAEETATRAKLNAYRAELARRNAVIDQLTVWKNVGDSGPFKAPLSQQLIFASDIPQAMQERERAIFAAQLRGVQASLDSLMAQGAQKQAEIDGLQATVEAFRQQVRTLGERVAMRTRLVHSSAGSRALVIDAMQSHEQALSSLAEKKAQLMAAIAAQKVSNAEIRKLLDTAASENASRKLEAERAIDALEQEVIKAARRRDLMTIRSPIEGTVQLTSIATAGQVIAAGTELMRIVASNAPLEIEAYLPNREVGFVTANQTAIVKLEAYPFTRFGVLEGRVLRVSSDAIPEPDAQQLESTASQHAGTTIPTANVPRVQNLVFPLTLTLDSTTLKVDGKSVPVTPGMAVTVEIKTGKRRILEYLFSPLAQIAAEAMSER